MVKTVAILAFIGAAGAGAVGLAMKKTVISGKVMAADLLGQLEKNGITEVDCDPAIPVGSEGAVFTCKVHASDGSSANIAYTMSRAGALSAKLIKGPVEVPSTSDPWSN